MVDSDVQIIPWHKKDLESPILIENIVLLNKTIEFKVQPEKAISIPDMSSYKDIFFIML
jgi:hypothetical protein